MTKIKVRVVDTFTRDPHTGNPAGVIIDGKNLSEQQMLMIAREINLSETLFVLPSSKPEIDAKIRCFAPDRELQSCGHSIIAGFHSLAEEGMMGMSKNGKYNFRVDTQSGVVPMDVIKSDGSIVVMIETKPPILEKATQFKTELLRLLNIQLSDFDTGKTLSRNEYLFIALKRLHMLFTMKPNFFALGSFLSTRDIHGVCVYTAETVDRESVVHSRFFAPHLGINEDPVTCSIQSTLAVLLYENGVLPAQDGLCTFQAEQGDVAHRRGRVYVEMLVENKNPISIKVGGCAVTVMEGEMIIND